MKTTTISYTLTLLFLLFLIPAAKAQRMYGNTQQSGASGLVCLNCLVNNGANAADGNAQTFSTLNVTLGLAAQTYQEIGFTTDLTPGTKVYLKIGTGDGLISVQALGGISLQAYYNTTPVGAPQIASALVSALSNNDQVIVALTPAAAYNKVRVTLSGGIVGALANIYLYEGWVNGPGPVNCSTPVDELHGITSALLGLGINVGGVANPQLALDGDLNTFSTLHAGVAVAGAAAQQTLVYSSLSAVGDSVRLTLAIPQALLDVGVLSSISVTSYNSDTNNGDTRFLNSSLLSVRLLDLNGSRRKVTVTYAPPSVFDRIQLRLGGGLAGVLSSLDFYEAQRFSPPPVIQANGAPVTGDLQVCSGSTLVLTAVTSPGDLVNWYTVPSGGSPVFTGSTFTTPPLTANTVYYAEIVRNGCSDGSLRSSVNSIVNPLPATPAIAVPAVNICAGQTATFNAPPQAGVVIKWYDSATAGTLVFTGDTFTTGPLSVTTTYYSEAVNSSGCPGASRTQVVANVQPLPVVPVVSANASPVNSGQQVTFTVSNVQAGTVYNWYTTSSGGSPVFQGNSYTIPSVTSSTTIYAEGTNGACTSSARASVTVAVNPTPDITITPPTRAVNAGQTASFTASSTTPGANFNWYTIATGGSPIFTGATYTTPPVNANATYYAEAVNPSTGAASPRATATVTVNSVPSLTITPPTVAVNAGQTTSFTASSSTTDATFNWYTVPTGGIPVFTGPVFTTPPINTNTTFYAEAVDPATGAASLRGAAVITINNAPDVAVSPPSRAINSGQTASFTASSSLPSAVFYWYDKPTGGTSFFSGANFTSPPLSSNTDYYAEAVNPATGAISSRVPVTVTVNNVPDISVTPPSRAINPGGTATFTASSTTPGTTFDWYTLSSGGTPIFTGPVFTTPPLSANTTYYADAVNPSTGAVSPRIPATVTINNAPDILVTPPTRTVNAGQTASFTASSTTPGATFNWYAMPSGGTLLFTGANFTSPALNGNASYYAEAVNTVTGAVSPRTGATVFVNNVPDIAVTPPNRAVNAGGITSFTASSSTANATFNWYTVPTGGTPVYTGSIYQTVPINTNTVFYAEAVDPGTGTISARATATVTVNNAPDIVITPPARAVNAGQTTSFTASSTTPGVIFNWYTSPAGGTPVFTGTVFNTPAITVSTVFYAEAVNSSTGAISQRATATVTVNNVPDVSVNPPSRSINAGLTASFTASSTTAGAVFNWYSSATSGTSLFTGAVFTTPAISVNTGYYVEATNPATGATSGRATATVLVNDRPDITVIPPSKTITKGATASFTASSSTAGALFNWYSDAVESSSIFTGAVFTTPPLTVATTYYAAAINPVTGATSSRVPAMVSILPSIDLVVTPPTRTIAVGQTTSFTASSSTPGAVFNWYDLPVGGTVLFTGPVFTTPALGINTVYYAEAVNPVTAIRSPRVAAGVIVDAGSLAVFIPNAFSPNGDGNNDDFRISGPALTQYTMRVYNQWGQLIFFSNDTTKGWDGTYKGVLQPVGVYVYYVDASGSSDTKINRKGTITLVR